MCRTNPFNMVERAQNDAENLGVHCIRGGEDFDFSEEQLRQLALGFSSEILERCSSIPDHEKQAVVGDFFERIFLAMADNDNVIFLEEDGVLKGTARLAPWDLNFKDRPVVEITDVYIDKKLRHRGFLGQLDDGLKQIFSEKYPNAVVVVCTNSRFVKQYCQHHGYHSIPLNKFYGDSRAAQMTEDGYEFFSLEPDLRNIGQVQAFIFRLRESFKQKLGSLKLI